MADERIFKVKIDGLEKSYKDTVKLLDVLNSIKDVNLLSLFGQIRVNILLKSYHLCPKK